MKRDFLGSSSADDVLRRKSRTPKQIVALAVLSACVVAGVLAVVANAAPSDSRPSAYSTTDLGTLGRLESSASAINNRGQIYGVSKVSVAQENGVGPDIKGPIEGSPVAPVEMTEDLSKLPVDGPIQQDPVEVPLQEPRLPGGMSLLPGEESRVEPPLLGESALKKDPDTPPEFSLPDPNFDGIKFGDPGAVFIVPDTNGDVGPDHYVQTVNSSIAIFDKEGSTLAGPMPINTLFAPLGDLCATGDVIDPIVNYDPLADRWVVMGFPFTTPLCIAVSRTRDPVAGGWFLYAFDLGFFPDYPKLGVWPDAYYLGLNTGPENVFALDRAGMLSGNPATFVSFSVEGPLLMPADLDGRPPRAGTPAPFVRHLDGDIWGGVDRLEVFEFAVDFEDPSSSTLNLAAVLPTDPFSAVLCGDLFFGDCAEQPNGVLLETLPFFLMWRLQYRNFGKHEALVANHTIDVDPVLDEQAGIRWYELRRHRGKKRSWTVFQQGDFAPQEPAASSFLHRWMGSIAMDRKRNIALGFSASSSTEFPSVRYVGRKVSDPRGLMPQGGPPDGDFTIVAGAGSQFTTRWGDYSSMSIDPVDGCTFWYTQEYIGADNAWKTRIGAFKFPSCLKDDHDHDNDD